MRWICSSGSKARHASKPRASIADCLTSMVLVATPSWIALLRVNAALQRTGHFRSRHAAHQSSELIENPRLSICGSVKYFVSHPGVMLQEIIPERPG